MEHLEGFLKIVGDAKSRIQETSVGETRKRLDTGRGFHFIDVREDHEWAKGHAKGAIHLPGTASTHRLHDRSLRRWNLAALDGGDLESPHARAKPLHVISPAGESGRVADE